MAKRIDKIVAAIKGLSEGERRAVLEQFVGPVKYEIGLNRYVVVDNGNIHIVEESTGKGAQFTEARWVHFVSLFDDIDAAVDQLRKKEWTGNVRIHAGGGWYVSVSSGFYCVDVRKFYEKAGEIKPSRQGIALRLDEWAKLKDVVQQIFVNHPDLRATEPCYLHADHFNQDGAMNCFECNPFRV